MSHGIFVTRDELDLGKAGFADILRLLEERKPTIVINCAAYTAVDSAEREQAAANRVNGEAVRILAKATAQVGMPLVTFSTDYVFDGNTARPYVESDPPAPINAYGRSKLLGERLALGVNLETLVIRTSWLISSTHPNFVSKILDRAKAGKVRVVADQFGCPTAAKDLAVGTLQAIRANARGILHMTNTGVTSWFELAREAVTLAGLSVDSIEPCTSEQFSAEAPRPRWSVLGSERRGELGIPPLPRWQDSLADLIAQRSL